MIEHKILREIFEKEVWPYRAVECLFCRKCRRGCLANKEGKFNYELCKQILWENFLEDMEKYYD